MARIRTIKPEFWRNEDLASISPEACLLAVGLLNHCDDEGYFNANPKLIEADIFPLRDLSRKTTVLLQELSDIGYIKMFSGSDGKTYGYVVSFCQHQVINKKTPSKIKDLCQVPYDYGSDTTQLPSGKERNGTEVEVEQSADAEFESFWDAYDKKVGLPQAKRSWKKLKMNEQLFEKIMDSVHAYVLATPDKSFRKHPATWLNNQSWNDEVIAPKQTFAQQAADIARVTTPSSVIQLESAKRVSEELSSGKPPTLEQLAALARLKAKNG